jgi:hypothetical protein
MRLQKDPSFSYDIYKTTNFNKQTARKSNVYISGEGMICYSGNQMSAEQTKTKGNTQGVEGETPLSAKAKAVTDAGVTYVFLTKFAERRGDPKQAEIYRKRADGYFEQAADLTNLERKDKEQSDKQ